MPHEFRTIEEFVLWLEDRRDEHGFRAYGEVLGRLESWESHQARSEVYGEIVDIIRSSNIGIVYPPGGLK